MDLRKDSTVGGKRIATLDDILKLENIIGTGTGGGGTPSTPEEVKQYYKLEVLSSAGTMARNGVINTKLYAKVYRGVKDVTDIVLSSGEYNFYWERYTGDTDYNKAQDLLWANNRFEGIEQKITGDDIEKGGNTAFFCSMYDKETQTMILTSKIDREVY